MMLPRALKYLLKNMRSSKNLTIVEISKNIFLCNFHYFIYIFINFYGRSPNNTRIPIDFSKSVSLDQGLSSVFDLILRTVSADWAYLEEIFEAPRSVMDILLKKVFEEIVSCEVCIILYH